MTTHRTSVYRNVDVGSTPTLYSYSNPFTPTSFTPTSYAPTSTPAAFLLLHLYCNSYTGAEEITELQPDALSVWPARDAVFEQHETIAAS